MRGGAAWEGFEMFTDKLIGMMVCIFLGVSSGQSFPPPLSPDEERRLFNDFANGDMDARAKLIEHNLRLVSHIVKK